jgi:hypothetical protein
MNQINKTNQINQTDWACPRRADRRSSRVRAQFFRRLLAAPSINVTYSSSVPAQWIAVAIAPEKICMVG